MRKCPGQPELISENKRDKVLNCKNIAIQRFFVVKNTDIPYNKGKTRLIYP
jgi:hypothetical protein